MLCSSSSVYRWRDAWKKKRFCRLQFGCTLEHDSLSQKKKIASTIWRLEATLSAALVGVQLLQFGITWTRLGEMFILTVAVRHSLCSWTCIWLENRADFLHSCRNNKNKNMNFVLKTWVFFWPMTFTGSKEINEIFFSSLLSLLLLLFCAFNWKCCTYVISFLASD